MVWVAVGLEWCENLHGDQGAQCPDKGYKNRPPTGNIELRQNEPAYSREHSAKTPKWPTAKKNNFFQAMKFLRLYLQQTHLNLFLLG